MRIGLASYPFVNHDVGHNLAQMEAALRLAQGEGRAPLLWRGVLAGL